METSKAGRLQEQHLTNSQLMATTRQLAREDSHLIIMGTGGLEALRTDPAQNPGRDY